MGSWGFIAMCLVGGLYGLWETFRGLRSGTMAGAMTFRSKGTVRAESPGIFWLLTLWNLAVVGLFLYFAVTFLLRPAAGG